MDNMVGVMPIRCGLGASSLVHVKGERTAPLLKKYNIKDALTEVYTTDAHLVQYHVIDAKGEHIDYPRCNKAILRELKEAGAEIRMQVFGIDWDNPEHQHWTPQLAREREAIVEYLRESSEIMGNMFASYRSRAGYRFIFALDRSLPVEEGERYLAGLLKSLKEIGIDADALSDWTRLFRLPFVVREAVRSWETEFCTLDIYDKILPVDSLTPCDRGELLVPKTQPINLNAPYPSDDEADGLREFQDKSGRRKPTQIFKEFSKSLKGRKSYPCIFEDQGMADEGNRNLTMMSFIGEAVSPGMDIEGCKPDHIYALFLPAVLDFESDQDWRKTLWTGVLNIWNKEKEIHTHNHRVKLEHKEQKKEGIRSIIDGMAGWDTSEELRDDRAEEFVTSQLIANVGKLFFIMGREGTYHPMPLTKEQLIPQLKRSEIADILPTTFVNDKGQVADISVLKIINNHSISLREIERIPETDKSGFIRHRDSHHPVLVLPLYRINPRLSGVFSDEVDQWLRKFFNTHYEEGIKWIAYALAFESGPICGLSLKGGQGAGKDMFVQGLSECLETPITATALDLTSQFQSGMLRSPFLWINEGWPQSRTGMSPADNFRQVTSGGARIVNDKFIPLQKIFNPMRVIFTANNNNVVQELANGRDLSPDDREAIAIRLSHYDIGSEGAQFLANVGGRKFTSAKGNKWIADDGGETDYVVAKHFLWLYGQIGEMEAKKKWARGSRFAVEGNLIDQESESLMFDMLTRHGKTPLVMETVLHLYEGFDSRPGCTMQDGKLYVLISEIVNYLRDNNYAEAKIKSSEVADALQNLVTTEPVAQILATRKSQGLREWYEMDVSLLYKASIKYGFPCKKVMEHCGARL